MRNDDRYEAPDRCPYASLPPPPRDSARATLLLSHFPAAACVFSRLSSVLQQSSECGSETVRPSGWFGGCTRVVRYMYGSIMIVRHFPQTSQGRRRARATLMRPLPLNEGLSFQWRRLLPEEPTSLPKLSASAGRRYFYHWADITLGVIMKGCSSYSCPYYLGQMLTGRLPAANTSTVKAGYRQDGSMLTAFIKSETWHQKTR